MSDIITVNKKDIAVFKEEGGKLVFKHSAEQELLKLLELKDTIDQAIEEVKENIAQAGISISPDFKGVVGSKVKAIYQKVGRKYSLNKSVEGWEKSPYIKAYYIPDAEKIEEDIETGDVGAEIVINPEERKIVLRVDKT